MGMIRNSGYPVLIQRANWTIGGELMTPDHINFQLTNEVSIGIGQDRQVTLLVADKWHCITDTNFGRFLLETQGWRPAQPVEQSSQRQPFPRPKNNGTIQ